MYVIAYDGGQQRHDRLNKAERALCALGSRGIAATLMTAEWDRYHPTGGIIAMTLAEKKTWAPN